MEPGSYIPPHRHSHSSKQEGFIGIRGRLAAFSFADQGEITQILIFGPSENIVGVDIQVGVWHTVVSLETGAVFYEVKAGPYEPIAREDLAPWAPEAGSPEASLYLSHLVNAALAI